MNTDIAFNNVNFEIKLNGINAMAQNFATINTTKRGGAGTPMMAPVHRRGQSTRFSNVTTQ